MRRFLSAAAMLFSLPAHAEEPDAIVVRQVYGDWEAVCTEQGELRECAIRQQIASEEGRVIAVVNGTRSENGTTIEFGLPLMMDLTTPVSLTVDDSEVATLEYNACNAQACFIVRQNDEILLNAFREGQSASMTMNSYTGQTVQIIVSLRGFSSAIASLSAE